MTDTETNPVTDHLNLRVFLHKVKKSLYELCVEEHTDPETETPYDVAQFPSLEELTAWAANLSARGGQPITVGNYDAATKTFDVYVQPARMNVQLSLNDITFSHGDV